MLDADPTRSCAGSLVGFRMFKASDSNKIIASSARVLPEDFRKAGDPEA
jgi:hypothetical protein